jgi:ribosomal protein S27AE
MSSNKYCLKCGSSSFVSDRSLGGKIVCLKCGSSLFGRKTFSQIYNKKIISFVIALLVVFIIIIIK